MQDRLTAPARVAGAARGMPSAERPPKYAPTLPGSNSATAHEPKQKQQYYGPYKGDENRPRESRKRGVQAKRCEQPSPDKSAYDADHDVADETKASADHQRCEHPCDEPDDQPGKNIHLRASQ